MLTPELIHPNFWKVHSYRVSRRVDLKLEPVGDDVKEMRRKWCERQVELLKTNPSNAVLIPPEKN